MSKKAFINTVHIEGKLYQHKLEKKVTGEKSKNPGTEYIQGSIEIATDNALLNIVPVYFTYVTEFTAKKKQNPAFAVLNSIINGNYFSVMEHGADKATNFRIDTSLGLNEFYADKNGQEELVSVKRNDGGFIHAINPGDINEDEGQRDKFKCDMVITGYTYKEPNEERNISERGIIKGYIFNYAKDVLPVEFTVTNPLAMQYFEGLGVSNSSPLATTVWGHEISETIVTKKVTESAWGGPEVDESKYNRKDFVIAGAKADPYEWDSEDFITAAEFKEAMARREIRLATLKKQRDEYKASKKVEPSAFQATGSSDFNF